MYFARIFSHSVAYLIISLTMMFKEQKFLFLIKSSLSLFLLWFMLFVYLGNLYLNKKDFSSVFFQKCFHFIVSSMIHFNFLHDIRYGSRFFFCQKSIAHVCESTSELSPQPDWPLHLFLCHSHTRDYCFFIVSLIISVCPPILSFHSKVLLAFLLFHINIRIVCQFLPNKFCWDIYGACVESTQKFEKNWHLNNTKSEIL